MIFEYKGSLYPEYLKHGNACRFIAPTALEYCKGDGLDIGAGRWPLPGAKAIEIRDGLDGMALPARRYDFIFSSHCLEHLANPIGAIEHWKDRLKFGAPLFLYLPHPEMAYWLPQNCRKHLHSWKPGEMAQILRDLDFVNVIHGERDLAWGFAVVGFNG